MKKLLAVLLCALVLLSSLSVLCFAEYLGRSKQQYCKIQLILERACNQGRILGGIYD